MAKHRARCRKCHNSVDDQDIKIDSIYLSVDGPVAYVVCGWCGHKWYAKIETVKHLRDYSKRMAEAQAAENQRRRE